MDADGAPVESTSSVGGDGDEAEDEALFEGCAFVVIGVPGWPRGVVGGSLSGADGGLGIDFPGGGKPDDLDVFAAFGTSFGRGDPVEAFGVEGELDFGFAVGGDGDGFA